MKNPTSRIHHRFVFSALAVVGAVTGLSFSSSATVPATASPAPSATNASSPSSANTGTTSSTPPLFLACGKSVAEFSEDLKRLNLGLETWAKGQTKEALSSPDLGTNVEGRRLRLFAAFALPEESPFKEMHVDCWVRYVEFTEAVNEGKAKKATEVLSKWKGCVKATEIPNPPEIDELQACWKKTQSAIANGKSNSSIKNKKAPSKDKSL